MPDPLAAASAPVASWLLTYLLHSTVVLVGAWAVTRGVRLAPDARAFLWRVALLAGVVTATGGSLHAAGARAETRVVQRIEVEGQARAVLDRELGPWADGGGAPAGRPRLADAPSDPRARRAERVRIRRWVGAGPGEALAGSTPGPGSEAGGAEEGMLAWHTDPIGAGVPALPDACRALLHGPRDEGSAWLRRVAAACADRSAGPWAVLLVGLWLVGAALGGVRLSRDRRALAELAGSLGQPAEPRAQALAGALGGDASRVVSSPVLSAPCVLPGGKIGLPTRCEELTEPELRAVLAHELAHVARRDVAWTGALRTVGVLLWLQPLNRLASAEARNAAEEACDDWALARTGSRAGLATSIARVAEWALAAPSGWATASVSAADGGRVSARVRRILTGTTLETARWKRVAAALLIAAPLPLLPTPGSGEAVHAAVFVEQATAAERVVAPGADDEGTITARVIVARIRVD